MGTSKKTTTASPSKSTVDSSEKCKTRNKTLPPSVASKRKSKDAIPTSTSSAAAKKSKGKGSSSLSSSVSGDNIEKIRKAVTICKKSLFNDLKKDLKASFQLPKQRDNVETLIQWLFHEPPKGSTSKQHAEHYSAYVQYATETGLIGQLKLYNICHVLETTEAAKTFTKIFQSKILAPGAFPGKSLEPLRNLRAAGADL